MPLHHLTHILLIFALAGGALVNAPVAFAATTIVYVDADASSANDGSSWIDASTILQTALTNANPAVGDTIEIWVAAGTYRPAGQMGTVPRPSN